MSPPGSALSLATSSSSSPLAIVVSASRPGEGLGEHHLRDLIHGFGVQRSLYGPAPAALLGNVPDA